MYTLSLIHSKCMVMSIALCTSHHNCIQAHSLVFRMKSCIINQCHSLDFGYCRVPSGMSLFVNQVSHSVASFTDRNDRNSFSASFNAPTRPCGPHIFHRLPDDCLPSTCALQSPRRTWGSSLGISSNSYLLWIIVVKYILLLSVGSVR